MRELIERLEKSTGPSRELDRLIGDAVGAPMGYTGDAIGLGYARFTESLDAALTLVPEGMQIGLQGPWFHRETRSPSWYAECSECIEDYFGDYNLRAPSAALVVCIAALLAREQGR